MKIRDRIKQRMRQKNVIFSLAGVFLAIALVSITIGRSILADKDPSLISFAIINFSGYLFFLLLPIETLIPFYISAGHDGLTLLAIALPTAIAGELVSFAIGFLMSGEIINDLVGTKRFSKLRGYIDKYGGGAIFFFNLFPLASSVLSLISGMVRFNTKKFLFYSFAGLLIKYVALVYFSNLWFF